MYQNTILMRSQYKSLVISGSLYWKKKKKIAEFNYVSALEGHISSLRDQTLYIVTGWVTCYHGQKIVKVSFSNNVQTSVESSTVPQNIMTIKILNHS